MTLKDRGNAAVNRSMEDELGPIGQASPGAPVTIIPRSACGGGTGVLKSAQLMAIQVTTADTGWEPGDDVIISNGVPGKTVAALAKFREYREGAAVFTRQSPWRPFNRRAFERYAVRLQVMVGSTPHEVPAMITDVSLGGASVVAAEAPTEERIEFVMEVQGKRALVSAAVAGSHVDPEGVAWHLRFEGLSADASALVAELVETLAASLAAAA